MSKSKFLKMDNLSLQHILDEDADLIPLMTPEDEEEINREDVPEVLPILPLRNTVLFPGVVIPVTAGRDKSIQLIKEANKGNKIIGVVAQKNESIEDPTINDIFKVGTVARILRMLKMPDGNTTVIIQGKKPFEVDNFVQEEPYIQATTKKRVEDRAEEREPEFEAIVDSIKEMAIRIIKENPNLPTEASFAIKNIESKPFLINFVSSNMNLKVVEKQQLLETENLKERALLTLKNNNANIIYISS
jgi:ATP-dependent Lon protease